MRKFSEDYLKIQHRLQEQSSQFQEAISVIEQQLASLGHTIAGEDTILKLIQTLKDILNSDIVLEIADTVFNK